MKLILIGGAQRSGTTLLQTLLANALDTAVLPEAHILCDLMTSYRRAKEATKKTRFYYPSDDGLRAFFRSCGQRHIDDLVATLGGGSALVLKDPNFVQFDSEVASLFPDAVRVITLRDPRDIAASFLRIGQREQPEVGSGKYRRRDVRFIGNKIVTSYAGVMKAPKPAGMQFVRYEELVTDPKKTLSVLGREAGLALSFARIDNPVWLEAEARHEASWISELEGGGPSTDSVGAYKTVMQPKEIALTEQICAPVMQWAGYEKSPPHTVQREWIAKRLARKAMRWMRKGPAATRDRVSPG